MEEFGTLWSYQESLDDARQQLLYTTFELETLKMEVNDQMRRHRDEVKQLIELVNTANRERDEARDQLQKILNKLIPSTPESPVVIPIKANSSITESNSLSDNYNHNSLNSLNSSPVDSFLDAVTSPDLSNRVNFINKSYDPADAAIERIASGRVLPHKGKLLDAVMEAGPLLQTLLVAGPLPRWRNPPVLVQGAKIPPVPVDRKSEGGRKLGGVEMWRGGASQVCSGSLLNFGGNSAAKRQRLL